MEKKNVKKTPKDYDRWGSTGVKWNEAPKKKVVKKVKKVK